MKNTFKRLQYSLQVPAAIVYAFFQQKLGGISDKIRRTQPIAIGLIFSGIVSN